MINTLAWDPWEEMENLRGHVDRRFKQSIGSSREGDGTRAVRPAMAAWEAGEVLRIEIDMPGVTPESLDVEARSRQLKVTGRRERDGVGAAIRYERTLVIPEVYDFEELRAELRDGVLRLTVPKRASAKTRRIEVATGASRPTEIEAGEPAGVA
jgi:HSP20 family protein